MFMMNLKNAHMDRYAPLLPFINRCRKLPSMCMTRLRNVSHQEHGSSHAKEMNDSPKRWREEREVELYFSKRRSDFLGRYSFVIDDAVAAAIAEKVVQSTEGKDKSFVVEINPGFGKITQCLLQMGIKKVFLCEVKQCSWSRELLKQYKKNVTIYFYRNLLIKHMSKIDHVIPSHFLLQKETPLKIIIINCSRMFIRNMLQSIVFIDNNLLANSELYILLSEPIFWGFQDSRRNTSEVLDYGFIDVVFQMKVLAEFPREVVKPPTFEKWSNMYFVRLTRRNKPLVPLKNIKLYWNFVNVLTKKKHSCVVASLEEWIPGCGPLLIANGLLVSTKVGELTKSDCLIIFKILESHGGFECQMKMLRDEDFSITEIV